MMSFDFVGQLSNIKFKCLELKLILYIYKITNKVAWILTTVKVRLYYGSGTSSTGKHS